MFSVPDHYYRKLHRAHNSARSTTALHVQLVTEIVQTIGRSRGHARHMPLPLQDQILSFLHTFLPKSTHIGGPCPPLMGPHTPYGKSWIHHCRLQIFNKLEVSRLDSTLSIVCHHFFVHTNFIMVSDCGKNF